MPITPDQYSYPFDPTGTAPSNKVTGEVHVITQQNYRDYSFVIPKFAPFFEEGVSITFTDVEGNLVPLQEGVDYYFGHHFLAASRSIGKQVYGSISFITKNFKGSMSLSYQTLGGMWTYDDAYLVQLMTNIVSNPRSSSWDSIVTLPATFPVIDHEWDLVNLVGMSDVVSMLYGIQQAILDPTGESGSGVSALLMSHLQDNTNPHRVTKLQVGLGSVLNYGVSDQVTAETGVADNVYMTPLSVKQAITFQVKNSFTAHAADTANPHNVTKAQVGLSSVQNYGIATTADAQAGVSNSLYMTPLLVKEAISELANGAIDDHLADHNNPHFVNAIQVGLGNVQNFGIATQSESETGTSSVKYMTPQTTKYAINALALIPLNAHESDNTNPHNVTKAQVGLGSVENFGLSNKTDAEGGTINNAYMTPLSVKQAITYQAVTPLNAHLVDKSNPHVVTAAQVGLGNVDNFKTATTAEAEAGAAIDRFVTPAGVRAAIAAVNGGDVAGHLVDYSNPHHVTASQVGAYSMSEADGLLIQRLGVNDTAVNSNKLENMTLAEITVQILANKIAEAENADTVGGKSYLDIVSAINNATVANSLRLENKTLFEVLQDAAAQTSSNSTRLGGMTLQDLLGAIPSTSEVARQVIYDKLPLITGAVNTFTDLFYISTDTAAEDAIALVTGAGTSSNGTESYAYLVKLNYRDFTLKVMNLVGSAAVVQFGVDVYDAGGSLEAHVWLKAAPQRGQVTVTELSKNIISYPDTDTRLYKSAVVPFNVVTDGDAPVSLTYATETDVYKLITQHTARADNPHGVTKSQVGLSSVDNYQTATNIEASTGTATNRFVTPANVRAAINAWLGKVQNYSIATLTDIQSGMLRFKDIYNNWYRYSHMGGTQGAVPADLTGWTYDESTDAISSTINSTSYMGLVSDVEYADYDFQVICSSTNADDDSIGIVLGFETIGGIEYSLTAYRTLSTANSFSVVLNAGLSGTQTLGQNDGGVVANTYTNANGGTGWSTVTLGIRAVRQGNTITIWPSGPNDQNWIDAKKVIIDLTSTPELQRFMTSSKVGFTAMSQIGATWKCLTAPWARNDLYVTPQSLRQALNLIAVDPLTTRLNTTDTNLSSLMTSLTTQFNSLTV